MAWRPAEEGSPPGIGPTGRSPMTRPHYGIAEITEYGMAGRPLR